MKIFKDINSLKEWRKSQSGKIGLVPTMGALHQGHKSLIKKCLQKCNSTVVSIFINPLQFDNNLDLKNYPNQKDEDIKILQAENIDALFLPSKEIMYSDTYSTIIEESKISIGLEGDSRPNHFNGVVTIVAKLFNIVNPSDAFFGEKDAQQLRIIQKLVNDLNYSIQVVPCPIIREKNGLAMSSRNEYLSIESRQLSSIIYAGLKHGVSLINNGERASDKIRKEIAQFILTEPLAKIDYISISDNLSLKEIKGKIAGDILISSAIYIDDIRLIDNIAYSSS